MKASLTRLTTLSGPVDNKRVSSFSTNDSTLRAARCYRHYLLNAVLAIPTVSAVVLIVLMTLAFSGCTEAEKSTHKDSVELERQFSFPEIRMQPRGITTDKQGNVVVVGTRANQAFAVASDRYGTILWQYAHTPDAASGYESSFAGALQLDNGNFLFCGSQSPANNTSAGWVVIVDAKGSVIEQRTELPEGGGEFSKSTFSHCLKRQSEIALIGRSSQNSRGIFWMASLDSTGKKIRDLVIKENLPSTDVAVSADGSLTLSGFDGGRLQMRLVRTNPIGEVVARREIQGYGSVLFRGADSGGLVQGIVYGVGNQATLHVLNEQLEDAKPPGPPLDFDARQSCSFTLPSGAALLFGRTSNAAAALMGPKGNIITRFAFDPKFKSFAINDAIAISETEFVTVTDSVSVDPKYQGLVISWIKLGD
jgi:hypothetical protein